MKVELMRQLRGKPLMKAAAALADAHQHHDLRADAQPAARLTGSATSALRLSRRATATGSNLQLLHHTRRCPCSVSRPKASSASSRPKLAHTNRVLLANRALGFLLVAGAQREHLALGRIVDETMPRSEVPMTGMPLCS
jgi:hypothetical protein